MRIEELLKRNLDALMSATPDLDSQVKLATASGAGQTTVGRMRRAEGAASIDNVHKVARAFKLRACDLLDPSLAERVKAGQLMGLNEARPPVVTDDQWRALSPRVRALVEDICQRAAAGALDDARAAWLHDGLQQIAPLPR